MLSSNSVCKLNEYWVFEEIFVTRLCHNPKTGTSWPVEMVCQSLHKVGMLKKNAEGSFRHRLPGETSGSYFYVILAPEPYRPHSSQYCQ